MSYFGDEIRAYIARQKDWSLKVFGPGPRTEGILKHIDKEQEEVRERPDALEEWVDLAILALDGAWRAGYTPTQVAEALESKQRENFRRKYPPPGPQDEPIEHIRG